MSTKTVVSENMVRVAYNWFDTYCKIEKLEIETLFGQLSRNENIQIRQNLATIFSLEEDKWSMLDILDGVDVLENAIKICLRSIENGNNLESHIIENIQFECVRYAFLIAKRQLTLYGRIEACKNDSFYKASSYQSIYDFCKIFSVSQKMSILLKNKLNIKNIEVWLNFDDETNKVFTEILQINGVRSFDDLCLMLSKKESFARLLSSVKNNQYLEDDARLQLKLLQLRKTITMFKRKWNCIQL
jgi:hypothetical protein